MGSHGIPVGGKSRLMAFCCLTWNIYVQERKRVYRCKQALNIGGKKRKRSLCTGCWHVNKSSSTTESVGAEELVVGKMRTRLDKKRRSINFSFDFIDCQ